MAKRINWKVIASNIADAREELERLERLVQSTSSRSEVELQIGLEHAYHHLNVAWNARYARSAAYSRMTKRDFNRWARPPKLLEPLHIPGKGVGDS